MFSNAARIPGPLTPLDFAFVDLADATVPTPEPSSISLLAIGLAAVGFRLQKQGSKLRNVMEETFPLPVLLAGNHSKR